MSVRGGQSQGRPLARQRMPARMPTPPRDGAISGDKTPLAVQQRPESDRQGNSGRQISATFRTGEIGDSRQMDVLYSRRPLAAGPGKVDEGIAGTDFVIDENEGARSGKAGPHLRIDRFEEPLHGRMTVGLFEHDGLAPATSYRVVWRNSACFPGWSRSQASNTPARGRWRSPPCRRKGSAPEDPEYGQRCARGPRPSRQGAQADACRAHGRGRGRPASDCCGWQR